VGRVLAVFSKWTPPADTTFHQFLGRLDSQGGFAVIETDNPDSVGEAASKFNPYFRFEIIPVIYIGDTTRLLSEGIEFRKAT
jgi:hypothetical protein